MALKVMEIATSDDQVLKLEKKKEKNKTLWSSRQMYK